MPYRGARSPDLAWEDVGHRNGNRHEPRLDIAALAVVSACVLLWGLVSARLERWDVSAPIAFVLLGLAVTHGPTALIHVNLHSSAIRSLAEVTLALVLFADASRVNVRALRADAALPARLLGIGLPLTIGAGAGGGRAPLRRERHLGGRRHRRHRGADRRRPGRHHHGATSGSPRACAASSTWRAASTTASPRRSSTSSSPAR